MDKNSLLHARVPLPPYPAQLIGSLPAPTRKPSSNPSVHALGQAASVWFDGGESQAPYHLAA